MRLVALLVTVSNALSAQELSIPRPSEWELARVNYHRVTSKRSPAPEPGAEDTALLSPLAKADGGRVRDAREWIESRRPQLVKEWTQILGKIGVRPQTTGAPEARIESIVDDRFVGLRRLVTAPEGGKAPIDGVVSRLGELQVVLTGVEVALKGGSAPQPSPLPTQP